MIPGMIPSGSVVQDPQTLQFGRFDYNTGFVVSGSISVNILTLMPQVIAGDNMRLDALWWRGSWATGWQPRVAFYFKYGTSYSSGIINGGGSKNHYIQFTYSGGQTATVSHAYFGDSTDFPQVEASIDRLIWFNAQNLAFNYFEKNLPA
jgi:hypothetical protein